ncbi:arylsulfatase A-like [Tigriopus californicus]|uniref:arylsulfatase A-like n=1 Tax=Tigriopus californicus TaxID=6832 RepID=UPI0027DA9D3A|nr:arylsulfatase A-like [Tigriopus californicus]
MRPIFREGEFLLKSDFRLFGRMFTTMETFWTLKLFFVFVLGPAICETRPNFLLILADDLGYGDLETNGHPTSAAPSLKKLHSESLVFSNFYSASAVCSPSRAALLTGLYPVSTGIYPGVFWPSSIGGLSPSHSTVAQYLREAGYRTTHIGKWHLGVGQNGAYLPTEHGFENYYGIPYSHDMCPCQICFPIKEPCFGQCNNGDVSCPLYSNTTIVEQPTSLPDLTQKYTHKAILEIERFSKSEDPFFMYLAYHETHHPQFAGDFRNASSRGSFGDALMEMDHSIGKIISALKKKNLLNNTLIFFTSDNGPSLMRHERGGSAGLFRCGKDTTWEGGLRVPAFLYYPVHVQPGITHELASTLDVTPTILALANVTSRTDVSHGFDLSPLFLNHSQEVRQSLAMFSTEPKKAFEPYAIRYKHFKSHFYTRGSSLSDDLNFDHACRSSSRQEKHDQALIFDLSVDPSERYDLRSPEARKLRGQMEQLRQEYRANVTWAPSEMAKGQNRHLSPCCSRPATCEPFPDCCDCDEEGSFSSPNDRLPEISVISVGP